MRHNTRLRRANDAVLTEMARSLLREDGPPRAGMDARRSTAGQADRARHAARRFRGNPAATSFAVPPARTRAATVS